MSTSRSTPALISSVLELEAFLSSIPTSSTLYLDFEGSNLSCNGTISIITVLIHPQNTIHLIDILTLGEIAFTTCSSTGGKGKTLKSIFEDPDISKFFWDVRNDADALWAHYRVGLAGVIDIQLLENASREDDKTYIRGLDKSVQYDLKLGFVELNRWLRTKKDVKDLMANNVFSTRPLDAKTIQYCVNDIIYLPALYALYLKRYEPQSESKKLGPWGAGGRKRRVTMDQMIAMVDEDMMGFYDDVSDDDDWGGVNAHDGAQDSEAFYSCWDKN
ncbi:hypothetical protein V501_01177 [Pseudogymnoascus sp. VKM F-4519 (FW-2642)]|nr:hypothetical protein V501_01177 [Pseudogymnoascus sp. VKM F-4519 (FW-2642)]